MQSMPKHLSEHLQNASVDQIDQLLQDMELIPLDERTQQRIMKRIRQKRTAGKINTRGQQAAITNRTNASKKRKSTHGKSFFLKSSKTALTVAASLILVIGILSIPSVSRALYSLLNPDYESDRYMLDRPEERTPIPEVEGAIAAASPHGDTYYIELLGEYSGPLTKYDTDYNNDIPNLRKDMGFPAFDKEEFSFLRDLVPEVREVLYDGHMLTVNTYFHSDHAPDFLSLWAGVDIETEHNLDMTCFDYFIKINGQDATSAYDCGYGSGTMMSVMNMENEDIQNLDGFWHTLEIGPLPHKLPDGEIEMTILYYIYDADVDDMGAVGNIGRVVHTFTFDATEGNKGEVTENTTTFQGEAVMTFWDWETDYMWNRTMPLNELTFKTEATYGSTGIRVNLKAETLSEDWKYCQNIAHDNRGSSPGIGFDLYVDGEFVKSLSMLDSALNEANYELPIFPSEYDEIEEIVLKPSATYISEIRVQEWDSDMTEATYVAGENDTEKTLEIDGEKIFTRGGTSWEDGVKVPLTGCDIHIPLPTE